MDKNLVEKNVQNLQTLNICKTLIALVSRLSENQISYVSVLCNGKLVVSNL